MSSPKFQPWLRSQQIFHLQGFQNVQVQDKRRIRHLRLECTKARLHSSVVLSAHSHQYLYTVLNIFRTASLIISTSRPRHHYQNAVQQFRCWLDEVRKTGKYVISTQKIRSPNIPIREIKFDVTWSYVKRQTAKMKLLPSVFSSLNNRVKIFVFVAISRRHFSIFM